MNSVTDDTAAFYEGDREAGSLAVALALGTDGDKVWVPPGTITEFNLKAANASARLGQVFPVKFCGNGWLDCEIGLPYPSVFGNPLAVYGYADLRVELAGELKFVASKKIFQSGSKVTYESAHPIESGHSMSDFETLIPVSLSGNVGIPTLVPSITAWVTLSVIVVAGSDPFNFGGIAWMKMTEVSPAPTGETGDPISWGQFSGDLRWGRVMVPWISFSLAGA